MCIDANFDRVRIFFLAVRSHFSFCPPAARAVAGHVYTHRLRAHGSVARVIFTLPWLRLQIFGNRSSRNRQLRAGEPAPE